MALFNPKTLISFLSLSPATIALFLILATANTARSQRTSFTYDFHGGRPRTLTYQGDAHFPRDSPSLRLTKTDFSGNAVKTSVGRVIYSSPVTFWRPGAQADFETTVKFNVKPNANSNNPADGITFFMAPVGTTIPSASAGGSFGIFGSNRNKSGTAGGNFGIFGSNGNMPNSVNVTQISDSLIGDEVTMRVNYVGATRVISAVVTTGSQRYEVSYVCDLSDILPRRVQVGLAASTGEYVAIHDVAAWYFTSTMVHRNGDGENHIRQFV
ncbi:hypothetical protein C2S51_003120 [Perilla frutescens var. frutescens]|nr:hypothetical protein C2S51_003120 [Perilla frutescens var. frutescens]